MWNDKGPGVRIANVENGGPFGLTVPRNGLAGFRGRTLTQM